MRRDHAKATIRAIHEKTERPIAEIRNESAGQMDLELTPSARALAKGIEQLPDAAKNFTAALIGNVLEFQRTHPALARLMFGTTDPKQQAAENKRIEEFQATHRTRKVSEEDE